jgi:hypothetical protein
MAIDDRPRKKKKQKSNTGLWIGLGIGGGVLLILVVVLIGVLAINAMNNREPDDQAKAKLQAILAAQQPAPPPPPVPAAKPNFDKVAIGEKKRPNDSIRARADRPERLNELRQIGLFYNQYKTEFNKPPQTVQEFTEYIKRDSPGIKKAIDDKYYIVLPKVNSSTGILAYEFDPDTRGQHGVVDSSGLAQEISTQDLVAAVKGN